MALLAGGDPPLSPVLLNSLKGEKVAKDSSRLPGPAGAHLNKDLFMLSQHKKGR